MSEQLTVPVLPLDDEVVLPGMVVPLETSQQEVRAAIDAARVPAAARVPGIRSEAKPRVLLVQGWLTAGWPGWARWPWSTRRDACRAGARSGPARYLPGADRAGHQRLRCRALGPGHGRGRDRRRAPRR